MAWMRWRGAPWPTRLQWRNAFVVGALMLGGGMGGTAVAEVSVGSGLVVAFIAVVPLMIAALNLFWGVVPGRLEAGGHRRRPGRRADAHAGRRLPGLAGRAGGDRHGLHHLVGGQRAEPAQPAARPAAPSASPARCCAAAWCCCCCRWPPANSRSGRRNLAAVAAWFYLVVFGSLIAFNAYMVLLARASAGLASSYTFVNPVIAMLLGVAVLGEVVSGFEWMAAGVVLVGVVLMLRGAALKRA